MTRRYRDTDRPRAHRGTGSLRERAPGVWEIRVVTGTNPVTGRSQQRSFTVHGDEVFAQQHRVELVARYGARRVTVPAGDGRLTVAGLLERFIAAPHQWSPGTLASHEPVARVLIVDRLGRRVVDQLTPSVMDAAFARWTDGGAGVATVSARFRVLHSAISWALCERLLWADPLAGMQAPPRPFPRKHLRPKLGRQLIATAEQVREKAFAGVTERPGSAGGVVPSRAGRFVGAAGGRFGFAA